MQIWKSNTITNIIVRDRSPNIEVTKTAVKITITQFYYDNGSVIFINNAFSLQRVSVDRVLRMEREDLNTGTNIVTYYLDAGTGEKTEMQITCVDCGGSIELPEDCLPGEIVGCPDCGLDYVLEEDESLLHLKELTIEGEDWGE